MTAIDPRSPCIVGIGRRTWRAINGDAPEPLDMSAYVATMAADDSGSVRLLRSIDAIHAVHCASWAYDDLPTRVAGRLGIEPSHVETSMLAGTSGQRMITSAAERMLAGHCRAALIVGAEALATKKRLLDAGTRPAWSHTSPTGPEPIIDLSAWTSETEFAHNLLAPSLTFALVDSARRAALGIDADANRSAAARILAACNRAAVDNRHAWLRTQRDADEIATPTTENRMISTPYTKYMVAIMNVDMAAAVILTTHEMADELGIETERRVYLRGWSFGRDSTHLAERPFLDRSPAMAEASQDALRQAGISVDDVEHLDLYSCFPSSLTFAADALGIGPEDTRAFSVTGGLPYHGGPSSNYTTHSIAEVVDRLRTSGGYGLVSGVGMHMTKHSWAVYSDRPGPVTPPDYEAVQARIDRHHPFHVRPRLEQGTPGTIAAASVTHARSGTPSAAVIIADLCDGTRAYAHATDAIAALGEGDPIGRHIQIRPAGAGTHTFHVD